MKTKMINSQLNNFRTYQKVLREMLTLAENVFDFENLPENIDRSFLNITLVKKGCIAFFVDEVMGLTALPFKSTKGLKDVYDRPLGITVFASNGYQRNLKPDEYVLMYDNNGKYPIYLDICQLAERAALCIRTQDINIKQQRTPRFFTASNQDVALSLKKLIDDIESNDDTVVSYDGVPTSEITNVLSPAPYVTDKIDDHLDKIWASFYRLIGVANLVEQKKERMITDEMSASQGGTIASRWARFEPRQRAIEEINKKFNMNISVRYYDGEPDSKKGDEDVSDDVSDVDSESVSTQE